jgi:hypothetical protein
MAFLPFAILAIKKGKALQVAMISVIVWFLEKYIYIQTFVPLFNQIFPDIQINVSNFDPFAGNYISIWEYYLVTLNLTSTISLISHQKHRSVCLHSTALYTKALAYSLDGWL